MMNRWIHSVSVVVAVSISRLVLGVDARMQQQAIRFVQRGSSHSFAAFGDAAVCGERSTLSSEPRNGSKNSSYHRNEGTHFDIEILFFIRSPVNWSYACRSISDSSLMLFGSHRCGGGHDYCSPSAEYSRFLYHLVKRSVQEEGDGWDWCSGRTRRRCICSSRPRDCSSCPRHGSADPAARCPQCTHADCV